jgi:hypothetical protein
MFRRESCSSWMAVLTTDLEIQTASQLIPMKTRTSSLLLLVFISIIVSPAAITASSESSAKSYRVRAIEQRNQPVVEPGTSEAVVRRALGEPKRKLDSDTWVYESYEACSWKIETGDCSTLLVTFTRGKVTDLKLINDRAEKVIAASLQKTAFRATVATK